MENFETQLKHKFYHERVENGRRIVSLHWNSMEELFAEKAQVGYNEVFFRRQVIDKIADMSPPKARRWIGANSIGEFMQRITDGWPEGLAKLRQMASALDLDTTQRASVVNLRKRKRRRGEFGNELDIHAVYQGRINTAWDKLEHVQKSVRSKKHVVLYFNLSVSWGITFEESLWTAALALHLTEKLMASGRSVRIYVGDVARGATNAGWSITHATSVMVKDYGDTLSYARLAGMATAGFLRIFGFAANCMEPLREVSSGLGSPTTSKKALPWHIKNEEVERGALVVCLDACTSQWGMKHAAESVAAQLKEEEAA